MHFGYDQQGGTITAAVTLTARLLPPRAGTGRLGTASMVRTCGLLALGAVQTLVEVADRGLKRFHLRLQGHFALHKPRVLRLPVIRLPLELDIGLLCQHHALLGKGSGVVAVTRRQIRDGVDIGVSALHGERYTRFFHIPSDLVVDHCTSAVESSSPHEFQGLHDIWTTFDRRISCQINSTIST